MEQLSDTEEIRCCHIVYKTLLLQEVSADAVVPDTLPDITRILDTQCAVYVLSRTLGGDRATVEGNVQGSVLCVGDGSEVPFVLELSVPFTLSAQAEALSGAEAMTVAPALPVCDARLLHSRKVQLRCEVTALLTAFQPVVMDFSMECEDPDALETLSAEEEIGYIAAVTEKSFVVSDEAVLPGSEAPIERILLSRVDAHIRETKPVASKLLLQGEASLRLVYLAPDDSDVHTADFTLPFSQILDVPEEELSQSAVTLLPSSAFVEPLPGLNGTNTVSVEMRLTAQVVCCARRRIAYVADAYCLRAPCRIELAEETVSEPHSLTELSQTLSDTVQLPDTGGKVLFCMAGASLPVLTEKTIRLPVTMRVVYSASDGTAQTVVRRMQAEWRRDDSFQESLCSPPLLWDVEALIRGDQLELRCAVTLLCLIAPEKSLRCVRSAQSDAEITPPADEGPSVVVVRADSRSNWELAKRFGSTVALIEAVNTAGSPILLIPRAR